MAENRRHGKLRARDADRVDACALLDAARSEGELTDSEHAQRTVKAMRAKTFGDIDRLIHDLQIPANLADAPVVRVDKRKPSWRWQAAGALITVAALLGALGGCVARTTAAEPPLPDPTTGAGLASFLAAYRDRYGDLMADEVSLYPDDVLAERPTADPGRAEDIYYNAKGFRIDSTSRDDSATPLDLGAIDIAKLSRLIAGALRTLRLPDGEITHIIIDRAPGANIADPNSSVTDPTVTIYAHAADDGRRYGHLETTLAGEPLTVHPAAE
ncbi:DUF1707 SHOCT-like domain-containing protein [Nocardia crassostreae]|uniref:DUF1707 SHOCT-like domain-containing protein n=1 Tax=Nocardia crassostreae TaxID=53428 RepID=UPI00082DF910|nr:DUF1707 domain-containing protein [Nocardia crassostreae]